MSLDVIELGLVDFEEADQFQRAILSDVKKGLRNNTLMLLRHPPVITIGRQAKQENILADSAALLKEKIKVAKTDRGGDVTFHGPGQLIAWPILDLRSYRKDVHFYLRRLEDAVRGTLSGLGISSQTIPGRTGVWVGSKKIASIGIGISNWVTYHGVSICIEPEDDYFKHIKPCGLNIEMTCARKETDCKLNFEDVKHNFVNNFIGIFRNEVCFK